MARSKKRFPFIEMGRKLGNIGLRSSIVVPATATPIALFAAPVLYAKIVVT